MNKPVGRFVQPIGTVSTHARGLRPIPLTLLKRTKNERLTLAGGRPGLRQARRARGTGTSQTPAADARHSVESGPPPRPVASKITDVTVYQGQALVTREVSVPEGEGTLELLVTPLPAQTEDSSLYTEGAEGLRVLSTRFRTRAVKDDTRQEVRAKEELLKTLQAEASELKKEIDVQAEDLRSTSRNSGDSPARRSRA